MSVLVPFFSQTNCSFSRTLKTEARFKTGKVTWLTCLSADVWLSLLKWQVLVQVGIQEEEATFPDCLKNLFSDYGSPIRQVFNSIFPHSCLIALYCLVSWLSMASCCANLYAVSHKLFGFLAFVSLV